MVEAGSTIGNYEVLQKIGQGAMGAVYMARHPVIGKRVALKIIHPQLASNDEMVSRFFNEARAVTQIGHPNIVDVQDFGQTPSGESFIVMELLEGVGLGTLLHQEGQLPIERAVKIAAQLTDGLRAAHARGIIHRDLKPDNIFLVPRGPDPDFVKILDFGLAKLTGPGAMAHQTRTGTVLGTAHYMAPEAAEDARTVDHRVDVYALGCILFQMIIGRVPFPGEGFGEVLVRQVREPPPLPSRLRSDVPPWLEKIILHALAKKADYRFGSMDEFGRALRDPVAWARDLDDHSLSDDMHEATHVRVSTPAPMDAVRATPRSGPHLPADAKTVSAPLPGPNGTEYVPPPTPAGWPANGAMLQLPHDGTEALPNPSGLSTTGDGLDGTFDRSIVRHRTASGLGIAAAVLGALALVAIGVGIARHVLYAPITVTVNTDPPGVDIVLGAETVAVSPAQVRVPRGKAAVGVLLQKAGYVSVRRSIEPSQDLSLDVTLLPEPKMQPTPVEPDPDPAPVGLAPPIAPVPPPDRPVGEDRKTRTHTADARGTRTPRDPARRHPTAGKKEGPFKTEGLLLAPTF